MTTKICSTCKNEYPATPEYFNYHVGYKDGLRNQCKDCTRKYNRNYYEFHPEMRKIKSNEITNIYKKNWKSKNQYKIKAQIICKRNKDKLNIICECSCNSTKKHYHHPDYSKPLEVMKLCPACHSAWHKKLRLQNSETLDQRLGCSTTNQSITGIALPEQAKINMRCPA